MSKYANLLDAVDPALSIEERHLVRSDVFVDGALHERGIDPALVTLPQPILSELAVTHACRLAAIEGSMGDNSLLMDKANQYKASTDVLLKQLNRAALGLSEPTGTGYGSLALGRG